MINKVLFLDVDGVLNNTDFEHGLTDQDTEKLISTLGPAAPAIDEEAA